MDMPMWLLLTVSIATCPSWTRTPNNVAFRAIIPGNITIGAIMAMRFPGEQEACSKYQIQEIEALEALLFFVDRINDNNTLLPNITLGIKVIDTCGSKKAALERAVKELGIGTAWFSRARSCAEHERPVVGVIGPWYSYEAVHITPLFNLFEIPLISFSATSHELSDKSKYEYFSRTIPSDRLITQAIADLLKHLNWTYVALLYSDEPYGTNGYVRFKQEAGERG